MIRTDGTANDGYADDQSLVFNGLAAASAACKKVGEEVFRRTAQDPEFQLSSGANTLGSQKCPILLASGYPW